MLNLISCKRTDPQILANMAIHYSQPKGFVGRNICYRIEYDNKCYGSIVGGSATLHLPGRDEFFGITPDNKKDKLLSIVNNIFYHVEPVEGKYPIRNFTVAVIKEFCQIIPTDWKARYHNDVIGFESLVELPRTGQVYQRDNWTEVGLTHGYTCKREAGKGTDSWSGKRVWDTTNLRPKRVFCKLV